MSYEWMRLHLDNLCTFFTPWYLSDNLLRILLISNPMIWFMDCLSLLNSASLFNNKYEITQQKEFNFCFMMWKLQIIFSFLGCLKHDTYMDIWCESSQIWNFWPVMRLNILLKFLTLLCSSNLIYQYSTKWWIHIFMQSVFYSWIYCAGSLYHLL